MELLQPDGRRIAVDATFGALEDGALGVLLRPAAASEDAAGSPVRGAFAASAVAMAVCDPNLTILQVNHALERLVGRPAAELTGEQLAARAHPDDREAAHSREVAVVRDQADGLREVRRALRGDGATLWLDVIVAPIPR